MSTKSKSLPRAKAKTLKMTVVIGASFIVSGLPYHVYEMIASYGDHTIISGAAAGLLGALAVANSVTNPYVFLAFNVSVPCVHRVVQSLWKTRKSSTAAVIERDLRGSCRRKELGGSAGAVCVLRSTVDSVPTVITRSIGVCGIGINTC